MSAEQLEELYQRIHQCERCFGQPGCAMEPDPERVVRKPLAAALKAEVMVLGESLGAETQRRSAIPYLRPDGSMLQTGETLDGFLGRFDYTIRPEPRDGRRYVYSTDAVQRWPGLKANGKKRDPSPQEVANCFPWFEEEVALVRPRALVVMGKPAAKHFFARYLGIRINKLSEVCDRRYDVEINSHQLATWAIPHASPLAQGAARDEVYERVGGEIAAHLRERSAPL